MKMFLLAGSAAALALGAPALAAGQHGGGHGGGQGGGKAGQQHGGQGNGQAAKMERGHGENAGNANRGGQAMKPDGNFGRGREIQFDRGAREARSNGNGNGNGNGRGRGRGDEGVRVVERGGDRVVRVEDLRGDRGSGPVRIADYRSAAWGACPPGLAAKNNGCLPPGQAKKLVGAAVPALFANSVLDGPYRDWYRDDDRYLYRMGDGYIYQVDRRSNLVDALFPYGFRDYTYYPVGMTYPSDYSYYNVPYQYRSYYPDGGDYLYRYGNGAIYSLDPQTQAVRSIVALLAGDLSVGQRLPANYGVYNVPLSYRSQYYDTPDNWYRYNDGYIYRVDPTTQLITAVINALV